IFTYLIWCLSSRAKLLQAQSKPVQAGPRKRAWIFLDFLGFLRPIRAFSAGYEQSKPKKKRQISFALFADGLPSRGRQAKPRHPAGRQSIFRKTSPVAQARTPFRT